MNSYIKGNIKTVFFKSDSGFMVGNFKVKETNEKDYEIYLNRKGD